MATVAAEGKLGMVVGCETDGTCVPDYLRRGQISKWDRSRSNTVMSLNAGFHLTNTAHNYTAAARFSQRMASLWLRRMPCIVVYSTKRGYGG